MASLGFLDVSLMDTATATQVSAAPVDCRGYKNPAVYLTGVGTISSGTVLITEAPTKDYAGTWATVLTLVASDVSGGKTEGNALPAGAYNFVRAEITVAIGGGGNVSLRLAAN